MNFCEHANTFRKEKTSAMKRFAVVTLLLVYALAHFEVSCGATFSIATTVDLDNVISGTLSAGDVLEFAPGVVGTSGTTRTLSLNVGSITLRGASMAGVPPSSRTNLDTISSGAPPGESVVQNLVVDVLPGAFVAGGLHIDGLMFFRCSIRMVRTTTNNVAIASPAPVRIENSIFLGDLAQHQIDINLDTNKEITDMLISISSARVLAPSAGIRVFYDRRRCTGCTLRLDDVELAHGPNTAGTFGIGLDFTGGTDFSAAGVAVNGSDVAVQHITQEAAQFVFQDVEISDTGLGFVLFMDSAALNITRATIRDFSSQAIFTTGKDMVSMDLTYIVAETTAGKLRISPAPSTPPWSSVLVDYCHGAALRIAHVVGTLHMDEGAQRPWAGVLFGDQAWSYISIESATFSIVGGEAPETSVAINRGTGDLRDFDSVYGLRLTSSARRKLDAIALRDVVFSGFSTGAVLLPPPPSGFAGETTIALERVQLVEERPCGGVHPAYQGIAFETPFAPTMNPDVTFRLSEQTDVYWGAETGPSLEVIPAGPGMVSYVYTGLGASVDPSLCVDSWLLDPPDVLPRVTVSHNCSTVVLVPPDQASACNRTLPAWVIESVPPPPPPPVITRLENSNRTAIASGSYTLFWECANATEGFALSRNGHTFNATFSCPGSVNWTATAPEVNWTLSGPQNVSRSLTVSVYSLPSPPPPPASCGPQKVTALKNSNATAIAGASYLLSWNCTCPGNVTVSAPALNATFTLACPGSLNWTAALPGTVIAWTVGNGTALNVSVAPLPAPAPMHMTPPLRIIALSAPVNTTVDPGKNYTLDWNCTREVRPGERLSLVLRIGNETLDRADNLTCPGSISSWTVPGKAAGRAVTWTLTFLGPGGANDTHTLSLNVSSPELPPPLPPGRIVSLENSNGTTVIEGRRYMLSWACNGTFPEGARFSLEFSPGGNLTNVTCPGVLNWTAPGDQKVVQWTLSYPGVAENRTLEIAVLPAPLPPIPPASAILVERFENRNGTLYWNCSAAAPATVEIARNCSGAWEPFVENATCPGSLNWTAIASAPGELACWRVSVLGSNATLATEVPPAPLPPTPPVFSLSAFSVVADEIPMIGGATMYNLTWNCTGTPHDDVHIDIRIGDSAAWHTLFPFLNLSACATEGKGQLSGLVAPSIGFVDTNVTWRLANQTARALVRPPAAVFTSIGVSGQPNVHALLPLVPYTLTWTCANDGGAPVLIWQEIDGVLVPLDNGGLGCTENNTLSVIAPVPGSAYIYFLEVRGTRVEFSVTSVPGIPLGIAVLDNGTETAGPLERTGAYTVRISCDYPIPAALSLDMVYTGLPAHEVVLARVAHFQCGDIVPIVLDLDVIAEKSPYLVRATLGSVLGTGTAGPFDILAAPSPPPPPPPDNNGSVPDNGTVPGGAKNDTSGDQEDVVPSPESASTSSGDNTLVLALLCSLIPVAIAAAVILIMRARRKSRAEEPKDDLPSDDATTLSATDASSIFSRVTPGNTFGVTCGKVEGNTHRGLREHADLSPIPPPPALSVPQIVPEDTQLGRMFATGNNNEAGGPIHRRMRRIGFGPPPAAPLPQCPDREEDEEEVVSMSNRLRLMLLRFRAHPPPPPPPDRGQNPRPATPATTNGDRSTRRPYGPDGLGALQRFLRAPAPETGAAVRRPGPFAPASAWKLYNESKK